jgi:oxalate decarboxylase
MKPNKITAGGQVQIADSRNFKVSTTVAAALVTVKPGGIRELHWHPNADEWQYYIKGEGRMTVFNTGPAARTPDFRADDVGYVKKSLGHYVENTGATDLAFLEIFKSDRFEECPYPIGSRIRRPPLWLQPSTSIQLSSRNSRKRART